MGSPSEPRKRAPQSEDGLALRRHFIGNLRRIRRERGMTQEDLAAAADIGRPFLSRIETGHFSVTLETVAALAKALGIPAGEMLREPPSSADR